MGTPPSGIFLFGKRMDARVTDERFLIVFQDILATIVQRQPDWAASKCFHQCFSIHLDVLSLALRNSKVRIVSSREHWVRIFDLSSMLHSPKRNWKQCERRSCYPFLPFLPIGCKKYARGFRSPESLDSGSVLSCHHEKFVICSQQSASSEKVDPKKSRRSRDHHHSYRRASGLLKPSRTPEWLPYVSG